MTASHCSERMRMASPSSVCPALLTSASTGPWSASMASKARSTASASLTSAVKSAPLRDSVATFQPSSRRRSAMAAPMPRLPPVTSAHAAVMRRQGLAPSS